MAALGLVALTQCKKAEDENFLLITLDTQRADLIGAYRKSPVRTPNIDALAENGILFETCLSPIPITLPAHATMFFSLYPHQMHLYNNGQIKEPDDKKPSLATFFKNRGFATAAFVSLGVLKKEFGLNEGFDVYQSHFPRDDYYINAGEVNRRALPWFRETSGKPFFAWVHYSDPHAPYYPPDLPRRLELSLNGKDILKFHLNSRIHSNRILLQKGVNRLAYRLISDDLPVKNPANLAYIERLEFRKPGTKTPLPFTLKKGMFRNPADNILFSEKTGTIEIEHDGEPTKIIHLLKGKILWPVEERRLYYRREVEYMDRKIGELLNALKELDLLAKTQILIVGDHGEGLGDYLNSSGLPDFGHVNFLYNDYTDVPLILRTPKNENKGMRVRSVASLLDVAPTILGSMGYKPLSHHQGRNLLELKTDRNDSVWLETHKPQAEKNLFGVVCYPWRLIFTPKLRSFQLFHIQDDPRQTKDVFGIKRDQPEIQDLEKALMEKTRDILKNKKFSATNKRTREMLRALGYVK